MSSKILGKEAELVPKLKKQLEDLTIENTHLNRFAQTALLISDLSKKISSVINLDDLLKLVLEKTLKIFGAESGSIFLKDENEDELILAAHRGLHTEDLKGIRQKMGEGISGKVAKSKTPLLVKDISNILLPARKGEGKYKSKSFLCVPLLTLNSLIGVINMTEKSSGEPFTEEDVDLLSLFGNYVASEIAEVQLRDRIKEMNEQLSLKVDEATQKLRTINEELTGLKEFNESIVRSIALGLVVFDEKFKVTFANQIASKITGVPQPELLGIDVTKLNIEEDGKNWEETIRQVLKSSNIYCFERASYLIDSEKKKILKIVCSPLRVSSKDEKGGLLIIEDISGHVMMEEKLTNTERLAVMGKLAASVAHDLNNPLDGSLRFINLAIRSVGEQESIKEWLNSSKQGLERMGSIISSLSEFSRSIHRRQKSAQINKLIIEAMESMSFDFARQKIQVFTHFNQTIPLIKSANLYQVFVNLMRNAIDAMPNEGRLDIKTELKGKDTIIEFSDTGEGIKESYIKNVFDSFFTTKINKKGLGLGLAICKTIVEELGGKISVASKVGKGTTFTISIPLKQND